MSVATSRTEIEKLIVRYGATERLFGDTAGKAIVQFKMKTRVVRFVLELPDAADKRFVRSPGGRRIYNPALLLAIKAKLETVESNIATEILVGDAPIMLHRDILSVPCPLGGEKTCQPVK